MFPRAAKLELFARRQRPDWTCLGDELDGLDIRDTLPALAAASQFATLSTSSVQSVITNETT